jgi:hypothetical protein
MPQNGCHVAVYRIAGTERHLFVARESSLQCLLQNETVESYAPPKLPSGFMGGKIRELLTNLLKYHTTDAATDRYQQLSLK